MNQWRRMRGAFGAAALALLLVGSGGCQPSGPAPAAPAGGSTAGMPDQVKSKASAEGTPAYADPSRVPKSNSPGPKPY